MPTPAHLRSRVFPHLLLLQHRAAGWNPEWGKAWIGGAQGGTEGGQLVCVGSTASGSRWRVPLKRSAPAQLTQLRFPSRLQAMARRGTGCEAAGEFGRWRPAVVAAAAAISPLALLSERRCVLPNIDELHCIQCYI